MSDSTEQAAIPIGIAVVEQNRHYLVGIRDDNNTLAGHAEFPGGKCHPGEAPRDCAERECREETGLNVKAETLLLRQQHRYDHACVDLHFWQCRITNSVDVGDDHQGFRWVHADDLESWHFPAGNAELISLLTSQPTRS